MSLTAEDLPDENQRTRKRDRPTEPSAYHADIVLRRIRLLTEFINQELTEEDR